VDDFVERKHGRKKVEYPHSGLESIRGTPTGSSCTREVMQISSAMAAIPWARPMSFAGHGQEEGRVMAKEKINSSTAPKPSTLTPKSRRGRVRPDGEVRRLRASNRSHSAAMGC